MLPELKRLSNAAYYDEDAEVITIPVVFFHGTYIVGIRFRNYPRCYSPGFDWCFFKI